MKNKRNRILIALWLIIVIVPLCYSFTELATIWMVEIILVIVITLINKISSPPKRLTTMIEVEEEEPEFKEKAKPLWMSVVTALVVANNLLGSSRKEIIN